MELDGVVDVSNGFGTFPFMIRSLDSSLKSPAMLEHLSLRIEFMQPWTFSDDDWSQPIGLLEVWRQMDLILTRPTCLRLQRVEIIAVLPKEVEILQMGGIETLIYDRLPLLRAKDILIVKEVEGSGNM
jgi:hypothetical protein